MDQPHCTLTTADQQIVKQTFICVTYTGSHDENKYWISSGVNYSMNKTHIHLLAAEHLGLSQSHQWFTL